MSDERRKSRFCDSGQCLEAMAKDGQVFLHNTARPDLSPLDFDPKGWLSFLSIIKAERPIAWPEYISELMPSAEDCVAFALGVRAGQFDSVIDDL
jgi:hypothetical protein